MDIESLNMKFLLCCLVSIAGLNSFAYTYVTNVIDDVVLSYRIDGTCAVVLRAELPESTSSDARKNFVIPNAVAGASINVVADEAFKASSWLNSVTIQGSVVRIGRGAFANCSNLVSVVIDRGKSHGLHRINGFAFRDCESLEHINLSDAIDLSMIDRGAFEGCKSLKHIELPESCLRLDHFVFRGCESLQGVTLPATVEEVPGNAFIGCDRLHEIKIAPGGNYLFESGILYDKSKSRLIRSLLSDQVESLTIEEGVTMIMPSAFEGCKHLKHITLPSSLKHIGEFAFARSGSKEIVLSEGLESIGYAAFEDSSVKFSGAHSAILQGVQQGFEMCQIHRACEVYMCGEGREFPLSGIDYFLSAGERELIKPGLESWRRAGFGGFTSSTVRYAPDVRVTFNCLNGASNERLSKDLIESCDVNFTEGATVLRLIRENGSSQYARDSTPADKCFRQFIVDFIMEVNPLKPANGSGVAKP